MNDVTNADRAERARTALETYRPKDDPEAMISDLMTDLLHLAASEGFDTERQIRLARINFVAEQDEEAESFEDVNESRYNQEPTTVQEALDRNMFQTATILSGSNAKPIT